MSTVRLLCTAAILVHVMPERSDSGGKCPDAVVINVPCPGCTPSQPPAAHPADANSRQGTRAFY